MIKIYVKSHVDELDYWDGVVCDVDVTSTISLAKCWILEQIEDLCYHFGEDNGKACVASFDVTIEMGEYNDIKYHVFFEKKHIIEFHYINED